MKDFILILILVAILALAAGYIYRAKKRGAKCIGCPEGNKCGGSCGGGGSCSCHNE